MLDKFNQYISTMKFLFFIFIYLFYSISISSSTRINNEQLSVDRSDSFNETNIFLDYIFNKYGSNGKISYEGFEHLLENLGLGQLKFEKEHTLDEHKLENGNFEEVHDKLNLHKHNHTEDKKFRSERSSGDSHNLDSLDHDKIEGHRSKLTKITNKHCFTPEEMLVLYNLEPNHEVGISPTNFLHMCPIIVYELDQKSCSYQREEIVVGHVKVRVESVYYIWLSALVSVFIISFVGLLGVCIVPLLQKAFFNELLSFLVALAVGTLCGDALLHLLPHAFEKGEDDSENVVILRAGTVFLAIVLFYLVENVLCSTSKNKEVIDEPGEIDAELKAEIQLHEKSMLNNGHTHSHPHAHSQGHGHAHTHRPKTAGSISAVAYMVIMGDGLHNLTDGLAIGAAFSGDIISGFTTAIAVFTHELPHELGDFAVLLQTGMTVSQAVFYNVVSSVLSFIGVAAGILLGNFSSASQWIYCITAGVFLYIALVNLVPEMKRPVGLQKSDIFIQISGILCGGGIMFLIALYEHDLEYLFLQ